MASDVERARTNVSKLIEYVNGIAALPVERLPAAADPYWENIRAIVASDFLWVGDADLPHSARAAYGAAVNGLMATDQLVRLQTTDSDKTLAMLVGLRDDQVSLDVARIALK